MIRRAGSSPAFTLTESLIVIGVIGLLAGVLAPSLRSARDASRLTTCAANLRGLQAANDMFAMDHSERYAPGSARPLRNLNRWHGSRSTPGEPFSPEGGPLTRYLGSGTRGSEPARSMRECPSFSSRLDEVRSGDADAGAGFETGCGGYGYNNAFVGAQRISTSDGLWVLRDPDATLGASRAAFAAPSRTLAFADAALAAGTAEKPLIEYSFVEPRHWPDQPRNPAARPDPSIHFRHGASPVEKRLANIVWLDSHVTQERRTLSQSSGFYEPDPGPAGVGWFGDADDNSLFGQE